MNATAYQERDCRVLGVGFGPSNIALAIAAEEAGCRDALRFIDAGDGPSWQLGMMLPGSDIQNNPLRDLVTPRNPRSHYSFVNYLKEAGRLFEYLNLGLSYPLRVEYAQYVTWAAGQFRDLVDYDTRATQIELDRAARRWRVTTPRGRYTAASLVLGTGRTPNIPKQFEGLVGPRVFHLQDYLPKIAALSAERSLKAVVVIGASQSAVEINLDLANRFPETDLHMVHRSFSMRQKDVSPFSDRVYFPEFVDYFHKASASHRELMYRELYTTNYSAADADVLKALYLKIYEERLRGRNRLQVHPNAEVTGVNVEDEGVTLDLRERITESAVRLRADAVILATGFRNLDGREGASAWPPLLQGDIASLLGAEGDGLAIRRDYSVPTHGGPGLYLNGLCEASHGFGDAGSFSLLSIRAAEILHALDICARHSV